MTRRLAIRSPFLSLLLFIALGLAFAGNAAANGYVSVKKDGVNIRSGPSTKAEVIWEVFKGFPLKVLKKKGKWARTVDFEGDRGWIYASLLSKKKTLIVKVKNANLRVGPDTKYEIAATAKYGVVFTPLDRKDDWFKVKHNDGTTAWIHKDLVWP